MSSAYRRTAGLVIPILALACSRGTSTITGVAPRPEPTEVSRPIAPPPVVRSTPVVPPPADTSPCAGVALEDPVTVLVVGTSVRLSGQQVVAGPTLMRWIKRDTGVSQHLTSARVSTAGAATGTSVSVGTQLPIGGDRYCVVGIEFGWKRPGSVSVQKLAP